MLGTYTEIEFLVRCQYPAYTDEEDLERSMRHEVHIHPNDPRAVPLWSLTVYLPGADPTHPLEWIRDSPHMEAVLERLQQHMRAFHGLNDDQFHDPEYDPPFERMEEEDADADATMDIDDMA
jgi:hypothetical protein